MNPSDFKKIGTVTIHGKRKTLYAHRDLNWWKLSGCPTHVRAFNKEEAVKKYEELYNRKSISTSD